MEGKLKWAAYLARKNMVNLRVTDETLSTSLGIQTVADKAAAVSGIVDGGWMAGILLGLS